MLTIFTVNLFNLSYIFMNMNIFISQISKNIPADFL